METDLKEKALKESEKIARKLYGCRYEDESGIFWKSLNANISTNKLVWIEKDDIYSGTSGIALYFLSLFKITQKEEYLSITKKAMNRVLYNDRRSKFHYYSFLTGRMGISFVLMKMSEILGAQYLDIAMDIAENCDDFLDSKPRCEYINGASGTLFSLLHLYDTTNDNLLLEKIGKFTNYIIDNAYYNKNGMHWDRNKNDIGGLCGFAHGASGIAYVFLEMGKYFSYSEYNFVAEQAMAYESYFYDEKENSWQDLRKGIFDLKTENEHRKAIKENNFNFFYKTTYRNAWCHGAPGNGYSRMKGINISDNKVYKRELLSCIKSSIKLCSEMSAEDISLTLCHGTGGGLDFLITASTEIENPLIRNNLDKLISDTVQYSVNSNEYLSGLYFYSKEYDNTDLFNGNAGIGYLLLRMIAPESIDSVLAPSLPLNISSKIDDSEHHSLNIDFCNMNTRVTEKIFPNTVSIIHLIFPESYKEYLSIEILDYRVNIIDNFKEYVNNIIFAKNDNVELIADVFSLELAKYNLDSSLSRPFINAVDLFQREMIADLLINHKFLESAKLILNPNMILHKSMYRLVDIDKNIVLNRINITNEVTYYILIGTISGVEEKMINRFTYELLSCIKKGKDVKDVEEEISNLFDLDNIQEKEFLRNNLYEQIKVLLLSGVLFVC